MAEGTSAVHVFPEGWYAHEPVFVPRRGGAAEEEGYLVCPAYDANAHGFAVRVLDASDMRVACTLSFARHVPYRFHACHL